MKQCNLTNLCLKNNRRIEKKLKTKLEVYMQCLNVTAKLRNRIQNYE